ncbi:MAG: hypothetical protein ABI690_13445 [Chloroflexota bacterium]
MNVTDVDLAILQALRELRRTFRRVYSYHVAMEINKGERMTRYYLVRLESAGLVVRPLGRHSGWVAA